MSLDAEEEALANSLVGRTITRARWFDASPRHEWADHETCWIWLDDGRVIEFSSYGYDASGAVISEAAAADVAKWLQKQDAP